jgi:MFS family permease
MCFACEIESMKAAAIKSESPQYRQGRIFYGWFIVGVAFLCWFAADAFGYYTFGLFIGPITRELGWTTVMITGSLTLRTVIGGLLGPLIGPLVDREHGARVVMSIGVLVAGAATIAVSRVHSLWQIYLFFGVFGAIGMIGFGGLVTNTVIAKWFIRKRGRAMGVAAMGVSISGLVFVPLAHHIISNYSWRTALVVLGIVIWILAFLPAVILVRRRPEDMGLMPDGDEPKSAEAEDVAFPEAGSISAGERIWTLGEALRTRALWLVLLSFTMGGLSMSGVIIHFIPYVESRGLSSDVAAGAMTTFAFCCALVKIPWGLVAERIHARYCVIASYAGCATGLLILLKTESVVTVFLYAVVYGIALGGNIVLTELVWANYFGRTFLGAIRGIVMPAMLISVAGGPLFAAWLRDITGSYRMPFGVFLITFMLGALTMILAKPPKAPTEKPSDPPSHPSSYPVHQLGEQCHVGIRHVDSEERQ